MHEEQQTEFGNVFLKQERLLSAIVSSGKTGARAGRGGGPGFLSEQCNSGLFGMGLSFLCKLVSSLLFKTWHMDGISASSTGSS